MSNNYIASYLFLALLSFSINTWSQSICQNAFKEAIIPQVTEPYTLEHSLRTELKDLKGFVATEQIHRLEILLNREQTPDTIQNISDWITSETHALFAYDQMQSKSGEYFRDTLVWLQKNNAFFMDSLPVKALKDVFITYGFEKEGNKADIAYLYKDPKKSDDEWLNLPPDKQIDVLKKLTVAKKSFLSEKYIAPTDLKPEYLDGYSQELNTAGSNQWGWEIRHKKYEISRRRLMSQLKEVTQIFKESHSLHTHQTFELPNDYKHFQSFVYWTKWLNDYLVLKGMEEGLHSNYLTQIATLPEKVTIWMRIKDFFRGGRRTGETLPSNLKQVDRTTFKFFSAGIRGDIYGEASTSANKKIGIEYRDITRDLDLLENTLTQSSETISSYGWETINKVKYFGKNFDRTLDNKSNKQALNDLSDVLGDSTAEYFMKTTPSLYIALNRYETGLYIDFKTGRLFSPSPAQSQRIVAARKYFLDELLKIKINLKEIKDRGDTYDKDDVDMAIKMTLSEWAKQARTSELYQNF